MVLIELGGGEGRLSVVSCFCLPNRASHSALNMIAELYHAARQYSSAIPEEKPSGDGATGTLKGKAKA